MTRLMEILGETVRDRCRKANLTPFDEEVRKCILRTFARNGLPPSMQEIADTLLIASDESVTRAINRLHEADLLAKRDDIIISAYPFSAAETRHAVVFPDGHTANALCAIDALGMHFMLGEDLEVRSLCPQCDQAIILHLKEGRIVSWEPAEALEYVNISCTCGCKTQTRCPHINLFCDLDHLEQWRMHNPSSGNGEIFTLEEALEDGRLICGEYLK